VNSVYLKVTGMTLLCVLTIHGGDVSDQRGSLEGSAGRGIILSVRLRRPMSISQYVCLLS